MPEGDTIHRTANRLRPALVGQPLIRFDAPRAVGKRPRPGATIDSVEAVGKHLLIRFTGGTTLRTHMRMTGSWHLYMPGEPWRKKAAAMRALVEVEGWVAVCFAAPEVELVTGPSGRGSGKQVTATDHLGPDLCLADADIERAARLLVELSPADREIGDALLDQRIACGVGNIWKSESLFVERLDPFTPVGALTEEQRVALLTTASRLLREQVARPGGARRVYGRRGRPCQRCGTTIDWKPQGPHRRGTYWCPTCQA
jgi:endonuclease-8